MIELEVFHIQKTACHINMALVFQIANNSDHVIIFKICFNDNKTLQ